MFGKRIDAPQAPIQAPTLSGTRTSHEPFPEGVIVVLVTAPSLEKGREIARSLVDESLVACVNLLPGIESIYRWEGKRCEESEVLLIAKTRDGLWEPVKTRIRELHPYQTPEILSFATLGGLEDYLDWVRKSTGGVTVQR
jgi:periplasmic divalent cation tolerance protein